MHFHEAFCPQPCPQGINHVFGVLGDGNLFMFDSFQRIAGGRFHYVAHESSGSLASLGNAHTTGRIGVSTTTHGSGLTNAATALIDGVPGRYSVVTAPATSSSPCWPGRA